MLPSDEAFKAHQIDVLRLDEYLHNVDSIALVKIDVEGFEPNVLRGMTNLLSQRKVKNIFCELNSGWLRRNNATPKGLTEEILSYGFVIKEETELQAGLVGHKGESFDLQDVWFALDL